MEIWIDEETRRRVNIEAAYKGFSKLDTPEIRQRAGVIPFQCRDRESDETHYNQEVDDPPYLDVKPKSAEQIMAAQFRNLEAALDNHLNTAAQDKRYNDRFTFALRAGYVNPFQAEAIVFATWMEDCNILAYTAMGEVVAGTRPMPTVAEFLAALPALAYPSF